jgi:hypothetical protein
VFTGMNKYMVPGGSHGMGGTYVKQRNQGNTHSFVSAIPIKA